MELHTRMTTDEDTRTHAGDLLAAM